ncbi:MAG: hypothetical protein BZ138_04490 [Methanosphaera sp. rholeuAM270]|nr:MAG: hypothetical protein BZ138_04490 [Methanosphaera sp. rholeuAM270]
MANKKLLAMMLIISFIATLGAISAADTSSNDTQQDTTCQASYADTTYNVQGNENTTTVQSTEKSMKRINRTTQKSTKQATEPVINYEELYTALNDGTDEYVTISLGGDEDTYTVTQTITLNNAIKSLIINGNGKTINGNNKFQFLKINHQANVVIENITVTQCYLSNDYGGAIFQKNGTLAIINSVFTNNTMNSSHYEGHGGVIAVNNSTLEIINSTFTSNSIDDTQWGGFDGYGGAISIMGGNVSITDSTFTSNKAEYGGAIYWKSDESSNLEILNSTFEENGLGSKDWRE